MKILLISVITLAALIVLSDDGMEGCKRAHSHDVCFHSIHR